MRYIVAVLFPRLLFQTFGSAAAYSFGLQTSVSRARLSDSPKFAALNPKNKNAPRHQRRETSSTKCAAYINFQDLNYLDEEDDEIDDLITLKTPYSYASEIFNYLPVSAIFAYFSFPETQRGFKALVNTMAANKNWHDADGGHYRLDLLLPPTNSIVVPMMSLLFAILVGSTVTSFRTRMLCVDSSLNHESNDLETLARLVGSISRTPQPTPQASRLSANFVRTCNILIIQYCTRICEECRNHKGVSACSTDCETNSIMDATLLLSDEAHAGKIQVNPTIVSQLIDVIHRLEKNRVDRISALNATYPVAHYAILVILAVSIMVAFLMETDLAPSLFLNDVELRLLWGLLVGTFSLVAKVLVDLAGPFSGDYRITSWTEFLAFRDRLKRELRKSAH